ncbi:hypothetical protein RRG08_007820 [Elysia crispata]|uniref:Uncharacterized protein n=1 Tax=Elysia crispata TaxID=231223 RepID=A0AAE1ADL4_9GAST|nr:hypothetical protein RRG08_007820 [Elysia crispata]
METDGITRVPEMDSIKRATELDGITRTPVMDDIARAMEMDGITRVPEMDEDMSSRPPKNPFHWFVAVAVLSRYGMVVLFVVNISDLPESDAASMDSTAAVTTFINSKPVIISNIS